ncbi:MAG: phosphodiester glycosidase family protein [Myxococcota bacterium]
MLLLLLACVAPPPVAAAPVAVARVTVEDDTLVAAADGLDVRLLTWSVPDARGVAWVARVPRGGALDVVPSDTVRPLAAIVGERPGAWAAIDGGFYEDGPMGLVVSDGVAVTPWSKRGGSGIVAYGPDPVRVVHRDAWKAGAREALQSIDRLVDRGVSLVNERADARRASRSAVAVSTDAVWIVAAVAEESVRAAPDGIQLVNTVAYGMTLAEFAGFLVDRGATEALNLDGAVSTQMIVATPTWRWDIRGARGTINAVVVGP